MAIGGPAYAGSGFIEGFARSRDHAHSRAREQLAQRREQLNEALRLLKESREAQDAIAKESMAMKKAQAEFGLAQSELSLIEQRRAQIMASPGKPFRDSALEGNLEKARERLEDAHSSLQESQGKLQGLIEDRDARIRAAVPAPKDAKGGWLGLGEPTFRHGILTPEQAKERVATRKSAIVKGETENTPENREFTSELREDERNIRAGEREERIARGGIAGAERALEVGRAEQGPQNEETRNKETFPLDKQSSELRAKQLESQSAMAAAAQEIQARQQQQASLQATPGYQQALQGSPMQGAATGKGGGGGGLLGAIAGKGGGMGAPAPQGGPASAPAPSMGPQPGMAREPTVGQALAPVAGKLLQMPTNQVMEAARQLLGGAMGGSQGPQGATRSSKAPSGATGDPPTTPGGAPRQGNGGTQHFHFHQAPAGQSDARPSRNPEGLPSLGGNPPGQTPKPYPGGVEGARKGLEPAGSQGSEWYHAHPEVPEHEMPQSSRASNMNQGVPTIDHPDKLKGLAPGSVFRAPDGTMKIYHEVGAD